MFWALSALALARQFEVAIDVRFSSSCTDVPDAMIAVNGRVTAKPALKGATYLRLEPGKHSIEVMHPWCTFETVQLSLNDDGSFRANVNGTLVTEAPIKVRHGKLQSEWDMVTGMLSPQMVIMGIVVFAGIHFFKSWASNPDNVDKIKKWQEDLQKQMEEAQKAQ